MKKYTEPQIRVFQVDNTEIICESPEANNAPQMYRSISGSSQLSKKNIFSDSETNEQNLW